MAGAERLAKPRVYVETTIVSYVTDRSCQR